jgi:adenylosuccinate lyase
VLRNMGVALGYTLLATTRCARPGQARAQPRALAADLDAAWEVLAEPIQTVMRRYGMPNPYEQLKAASRRGKLRLDRALSALGRQGR